MKRYLYIMMVLAVAAVAVGIGSQMYLARSLSDVKITEYTHAGDKKYADGITLSQMIYVEDAYNFFGGDTYYCWDIDTDAADPDASKVKVTQKTDEDVMESGDLKSSNNSDAILIQPFVELFVDDFDDEGATLKEMMKKSLYDYGDSMGASDDEIYDILKSVSDQVGKGETKTVTIRVKDYTDKMPMVLSGGSGFYTIEDATQNGKSDSAFSNSMKAILDQLPDVMAGDEEAVIGIKKNKSGKITELSIESEGSDDSDASFFYTDCLSILTEKGMFFTFAGDSLRKTTAVYYVPLKTVKEDDGLYVDISKQSDITCKKLIETAANEKIRTLNWDDQTGRLLVVTSDSGKYTLASYDYKDITDVQKIQLFGEDSNDSDDGSDDLDTVVYQGDNLWAYVNGTHGMTALQYNNKANKYEVVMDLNCNQAFDGGSMLYYQYDRRTKIAYQDGRLAILYPLEYYFYDDDSDAESDEEDEFDIPGETALGVFTQDGLQYFGSYHSSLFDDDGYNNYHVSADMENEYGLNIK